MLGFLQCHMPGSKKIQLICYPIKWLQHNVALKEYKRILFQFLIYGNTLIFHAILKAPFKMLFDISNI